MNQVIEHVYPRGVREWLFASGFTALIGLLIKGLFVLWTFSALLTSIQDSQASLSAQVSANYASRREEIAGFNARMDAMDRRIAGLEVSRATADQQQANTAAAISSLQAQNSGIQSAVNDMRDVMRTIEGQLASIVRAANTPLPGPRH